MIAESASLPETLQFEPPALSQAAPNPSEFRVSSEANSPAQLVLFLLYADSPEAVHMLQSLLPRCKIETRFPLVIACGSRLKHLALDQNEPASPATQKALEALLISELTDDTGLNGMTIQGTKLSTIAEVAALQLARQWPVKYHYDPHASAPTRAAQLTAIRARSQTAAPPQPNTTDQLHP